MVDRIREATADGGLVTDVTKALRKLFEKRRKDLETERRGLPTEIAAL